MDIFQTILNLHPDITESSQGWWRCNADSKHRDKTLCFNFESMWVNEFRTGYSKSIYSYLIERGIKVDYSEVWSGKVRRSLKPDKVKVKLSSGFKLLGDESTLFGTRALKYMTGSAYGERNIPFEVCQQAFVGYDDDPESEFYGCIIFPCLAKGEIVYFSARSFLPVSKKHVNVSFDKFNIGSGEVIYNSDALFLFDKIYLCEGTIDALTCWPYGVATYKWKISPNQYRILNTSKAEFVIPFDRGFKKQAINTAVDLTKMGKKVKLLDLQEYEGKDVNNWGFELVQQVEKETDYFTLRKMFFV